MINKSHTTESNTTTVSKHPSAKLTLINHYNDRGWNAYPAPENTVNSVVAHRGSVMHFIKIVPDLSATDGLYNGIVKNTFIQNAFSNGARPIYAVVNRGGQPITLRDVNIDKPVKLQSSANKI